MELSRNRKILVVAFGVMAVFGFLLTPAGLETRPPSTLRSYALIPIFLATVILGIASFVLIFMRPRTAAILGSIAAISYIFLVPGDQAGLFFLGVPVPPPISLSELIVLIPSVAVLLCAPLVYSESTVRSPTIVANA